MRSNIDENLSISVCGLRRVYAGKRKQPAVIANDEITFDVRRGEVFGLLGPNGAGKTTLVLQLLGLAKPTSGSIWLEGVDVVREPRRVKPLTSYLPQSGLPMRFLTVKNALYYTGRLRGQSYQEAEQQTRELLDALDLCAFERRSVKLLSGGLLRLAHFAMALMGNPRVVILDEPTNGLDPHRRRMVWDIIAKKNREMGMTCVLVTHNVLEAEKVVHRVGIMCSGRMKALGTPGELNARFGKEIRLDLHLKEDMPLCAEDRSLLLSFGRLEEIGPGQFRCYMDTSYVSQAAGMIAGRIGFDKLENFSLSPPSLEDIYLHLDFTPVMKQAEAPLAGVRP